MSYEVSNYIWDPNDPMQVIEANRIQQSNQRFFLNLDEEIEMLEFDLRAYHNRLERYKQQSKLKKTRSWSAVNEQLIFEKSEKTVRIQEQLKLFHGVESLLAQKKEFAQLLDGFRQHQQRKLDEVHETLDASH